VPLPREAFADLTLVPTVALQFPLELPLPEGFDHEREDTWPDIVGSLEFVGGRLLYMPPSGDRQNYTCADLVLVLGEWRRTHREFMVGGNEAGMIRGRETRAADAAVWRRADVGPVTSGYLRVPPVLAVEVAGKYDGERYLREKAAWYLGWGVDCVWLLFPGDLRVLVLTAENEETFRPGQRLSERAATPGLAPLVDELFEQVSGS
jgi:Uma2 family endonuclease